MSRQSTARVALLMALLTAVTGCHPTQPFYFHEDGDLSHFLKHATAIEYPDVEAASLAEVTEGLAPRTVSNPDFQEIWDLSLEEVISITLHNTKVLRDLGGVTPIGFAEGLVGRLPGNPTIYDPAIVSAATGGAPHPVDGSTGSVIPAGSEGIPRAQAVGGVEDALSEFDAQFFSSLFYQTTDRPRNVERGSIAAQFQPFIARAYDANYLATISKRNAGGGVTSFRSRTEYNRSNSPSVAVPSFWTQALEVEYSQPLLRGRGVQINRIPVVLARINEDISLASFEAGVRDLVLDVENAYWDLYFAYRNLEANTIGRDSALGIWRLLEPQARLTRPIQEEAQAREQYFFFAAQVKTSLNDLFNAEGRLRYLMGLAPTDHRLIRPKDEPTKARVEFSWQEALVEALYRSPELRQQKWSIKQRELELIGARNQLLPRLNASALVRWVGVGDQLINADRNGLNFSEPGSTAFDELTEGRYQEVAVGVDFVPARLGARRQLSGVRFAELNLIREKERLRDQELNQSHLLTAALRDLATWYTSAGDHLGRLVATETEVDALQALVEEGAATMDIVLDAQRRQTQALVDYYRALSEYNKSIAEVHFFKGTLLQYDNVHLAEGPWPKKAYWDALEKARERDASYYLDYGYTRPDVVSRGPLEHALPGDGGLGMLEGFSEEPVGPGGELIPTPAPTPAAPPAGGEPAEEPLPGPGPITRAPGVEGPSLQAPETNLTALPPNQFLWGPLGFDEKPVTAINPLRQVGHTEALR